MKKSLKDLTVSVYKLISMILIAALYFIGFVSKYSSMMVLSRTLAVTLFTFGITYIFSTSSKTVNGNQFRVFKFRSMRVHSENSSASSDDERITRVGKVLRKIRLDELPQLLNILIGDMSLVGPRPEMIENIEAYEKEMPEFKYRLKAKAGLTGLAQIEGKYNTLPEDKLILDLIYIENYSIWLDIKIIFKTVIIFFKKDSTEGFK